MKTRSDTDHIKGDKKMIGFFKFLWLIIAAMAAAASLLAGKDEDDLTEVTE